MKPTLLVMAAGMGSRYGGLKQLDGFGPGGETLLHYAVFDAVRAGFGKVVFVIRPEMEADFREIVCTRFEGRVPFAFAFQTREAHTGGFQAPNRTKPWGTGQAVLVARELIAEPFAVINADDFYGVDAFEKMAAFLSQHEDPRDYAMVAYTLRHTLSPHGHVSRGVCEVSPAGYLEKVTERFHIETDGAHARYLDGDQSHPLHGETLVSMNMWGFQPSLFERLAKDFAVFLQEKGGEPKTEFVLPSVVDTQIKEAQAQVKVLHTDAHWLGVTYPSDRQTVIDGLADHITKGTYPNSLWNSQV